MAPYSQANHQLTINRWSQSNCMQDYLQIKQSALAKKFIPHEHIDQKVTISHCQKPLACMCHKSVRYLALQTRKYFFIQEHAT